MLSRIQAIFVTLIVLSVVCCLVVVAQLISLSTSPGAGGQVLKIHKRPSSRDAHPLPVPKCSDPLCTEFLSKEERSRLDRCLHKSYNAYHLLQNGTCRFMSQSGRAPVALASHPGSGNTWLRGLLETATGVCTGSVFCDLSLRAKGFAGEFIMSGAVLVVKIHWFPSWKDNKGHFVGRGVSFDSAVFLVRNPLDVLVAEWNLKVSKSHVKSVGKEMFGEGRV